MSSTPYSQPGPESQPDPDQAGPEIKYVPETSGRPTGVTVFAILHVLFGFTGILGVFLSWGMMLLGDKIDLGPNPIMDLVKDNTAYHIFTIVMGVFGLGFSAALLASGVGLLKMRRWARTVALTYAVYAIVATIIGNVANYHFIYRPVMDQAMGQQGGQELALISGILGGVIGGCISLILPIAILIYFLRPTGARKFEG